MSEQSRVGKYVKSTDPAQFANICSIIQSKSLTKVGQYVEMTDPEMYDTILEGN